MDLPFDTVLSASSSFLKKFRTRNQHDQRLLSRQYSYQRDLLDDSSNDIRICLVRSKLNVRNQPTRLFAVKVFVHPQKNRFRLYTRRVTAEFCIAHTLQHPNVVRVIELLHNDHGDLCQVMEYCDAGSLLDLLTQVNHLTHDEADCFFKQLLHAVQYIHSVGVAHRNLKPENILLTKQGTLKITDFCYAECFRLPWAAPLKRSFQERSIQHRELKGTIAYMAPEQFTKAAFDPAAGDMWAIGIIYFAMRSGRLPWKRATEEDAFYRQYLADLENGRVNKYMDFVSTQTHRHVLYSILQPSPRYRFTATQVLDSDWIRETKLCAAASGSMQST
ncbi:myosin light chain kinase, putative [Talaromyces stipitatus ATCC 10500]|uniref:non-specific serine/threonine protein kinase n=1 Tax=Talaromyces stipitatus (strain ATCC 10500 / CBS 375.48 / QM 6759 / NRRL 1006) TaxID=441959 RepID=B8MHR5_TALSN|nr:myosin light chain kinase, putative [Talaromyces stipitatus ATCC 10500]EED16395.1 myosin light chain kinase, putative [Talaromyces stipitatus ATCC 10500]